MFEPITNARCSVVREATEVPNQRTLPSVWKSAARKRVSMFWLPKPRVRLAAKNNSSAVLCGLAKVPMACGPCCALTPCKPLATYSRAVCQSTSFHSPPCLSMGLVKRSALSKAS